MNATRQQNHLLTLSLAALGALAVAIGCSSTGPDASGTGGSTAGGTGGLGTGGAMVGTGGTGAGSGGRGTGGLLDGTGGRGTGGVAADAGAGSGGRGTGGSAADAAADAGRGTGGATTDGGATITVTSSAFTDGQPFPAANTCTGGSHQSPPLLWTAGPSGTMSYAVILIDTTNGFRHWVLWDLPASYHSLPGNLTKTATVVDPPARQANRFGSNGYFGPCPGATPPPHVYVFEVHALDVAMLSVAATVPTTQAGVDSVVTQIQMHTLAQGTLSGTSNAAM